MSKRTSGLHRDGKSRWPPILKVHNRLKVNLRSSCQSERQQYPTRPALFTGQQEPGIGHHLDSLQRALLRWDASEHYRIDDDADWDQLTIAKFVNEIAALTRST
jgi:hypothetical protein